MKCHACGKEMTSEKTGSSYIAVCLNVDFEAESKEKKSFIQKQLGKYEIGKDYCVCFECWYKSLGIKHSPEEITPDKIIKTKGKIGFDDLSSWQKGIVRSFNKQGSGTGKSALIAYLFDRDEGASSYSEKCRPEQITKTEENDGVLVCKYKGRLNCQELHELKEKLEKTYGGKKKILLLSDRFDIVDVPFIKIDVNKIQKETWDECYPLGTHIEYIDTMFKKYIDEINKQLQGKTEIDESEHHYLCSPDKCFMTCPIFEKKFAKKPVEKDPSDKTVLRFLYARLIEKYGEDNLFTDYMKRFKKIIDAL